MSGIAFSSSVQFYFKYNFKYVFFVLFCRPIGWDSDKKISLLHEQMATMSAEDAYEDRITEPPSRKVSFVILILISFFLFLMLSLFYVLFLVGDILRLVLVGDILRLVFGW